MDKVWIKLYTKILENPKVGRLDDKTWRIMMELFLVAGETFDDGRLPDIETLAWKLRRSEKEIKEALQKLEKIGTVTVTDDNVMITNFVSYQNTNQSAYERVKRYRSKAKNVSNDNVNHNADDNADDNETVTHDNAIDKDKELRVKEEEKELRDREEEKDEDTSLSDDREVCGTRKQKAAKEPKHKYGAYNRVLLTDAEYGKLSEKFPDLETRIQRLDEYLENHHSKHYDSHYLTILTWARKDQENNTAQQQYQQPKKTYTFSEALAMQKAGLI